MLPPRTRDHLLLALGTTPRVLQRLISSFPTDDPAWDTQIPERFTAREHVAHLADWEDVFFERVRRTIDEDRPLVPNPDETAMAADRGFALSNPHVKAQEFAERRERLVSILEPLTDDQWQRIGIHPNPRNGPMTIEAQAVHVLAHDGYHMDYLSRHLV